MTRVARRELGRQLRRLNLSAIPIGITEDGTVWYVCVAGTHVFICGATGSGKGSVQSAILGGLAPGVAAGLVEVWLCDPKGMELALWEPLAARYARPTIDLSGEPTFEPVVGLVEDAARLMIARSDAKHVLGERKHIARPGDPLVVVVLDELACLTAYMPDEGKDRWRSRAKKSLSILLSQGRAPGVAVVANLQDPRKEVIPQRGLFPTTICLRQTEAEMVDLVLGRGTHDRGARAEDIPEHLAGVGYVLLDGQREPTRVRASWWDDDDIAACVARYVPDGGATSVLGDLLDQIRERQGEGVAA
jgi:DNA segregation ATPase FtsK/SpoIIIE, S-DNA-T family